MRYRADQHLRRATDFLHIRTHGRRYDCGAFVLWHVKRLPERARAKPNADSPSSGELECTVGDPPARLGVVASKSSVGNAVARARAKRRLREVFRAHQTLVPDGTDILLVARGTLNGLEYTALEQRFMDACRKLFPTAARTPITPPRAD
jgi:ribonuclease P protein component